LATLWPAEVFAQRRIVRRAPGRSVVFVGAGYYSPYYPRYYYDPFFWNWGGGWYPYAQYPPYGPRYYGGYYAPGADLRIQVTPRDAEVYVDGYFAGTVDDFDGALQRLRVPYGGHEIEVYFEGYQSIRQKMLFRPGESYHIRETMRPLAAGAVAEPRPVPAEPEPRGMPATRVPREDPMGPPPAGRQPAGRQPVDRPTDREDRAAFGTLIIRVQPAGAEILVDGERWETPEGQIRLSIDVVEGNHRIEIRKDGYKPYSSNVRVRRGETLPLNVSLPSSQDEPSAVGRGL
jgi:hypothetical protein